MFRIQREGAGDLEVDGVPGFGARQACSLEVPPIGTL
jgi:hypothetical protein